MTHQICKLGIWDSTIPGITFDETGVSNYAKIQKRLMEDYPRGDKGHEEWIKIMDNIKANRKTNKYDCIVGVSGGTDSSYLLHILKKEYNINPLAVNLDNGWNSEIAVANIKNMTSVLGVDLETYVIDYEEIKDLMRAYMKAGLPWIDVPTDIAIRSILYKMANKEKIKYIFTGQDFRTEGKQPTEWTYSDQRQLKYLHNRFGQVKLKTYPLVSIWQLLYLGYLKNIKLYSAFSFINYNKTKAQKYLKNKYNWQYYGEHHHENLFTKFAIGYWMYEKFGIDKRKITYSAQALSGEISRDEALNKINTKPYTEEEIGEDLNYILNKLSFTKKEFEIIWNSPNKSFGDFPSYYHYFKKFHKYIWPIISKAVPIKPKIFYEIEERE